MVTRCHRPSARLLRAVGLVLSAATVTAQAAPQAESASGGIEEIVVTAERREATAREVPLSLAALPADLLDTFNIENIQNLAQLSPGVTFGTIVVYGQPYIRGIGSDLTTPGSEASVALYVDGVYQARSISLAQNLNNVERVVAVPAQRVVVGIRIHDPSVATRAIPSH